MSSLASPPFAAARKQYVTINGARHGLVTVPATDPAAPILLFAHGGPGAPLLPMLSAHGFDLRDVATVVLWDQRGAGMSASGVDDASLTLDQLVCDTAVLLEHVREEHGRDAVALAGHSWGSYLGAVTAARHPELVSAVIGIGQVNRLADTERVRWHYYRKEAHARGDSRTTAALDAMADENLGRHRPWGSIQQREALRTGTGMLRRGYGQRETIADVLRCRQYSWRERLAVLPGMFRSHRLYQEIYDVALTDLAPRLAAPLHVFAGARDSVTPAEGARAYYEAVDAPHKTWTDFPDSAHSPFIDEPGRFRAAVRDVLG